MILFLLALLFILLVLLVFGIFFIISAFTGAPYVPMQRKEIDTVVRLARLTSGQTLIDLGSGDGSILIAAAKSHIRALGYEINPVLCALTWLRIQLSGTRQYCTILCCNFWNIHLSNADALFVYGIPHIMQRLQSKIQRECRKGVYVISFGFRFPDWEPIEIRGRLKVYRV
ncbi:MAG: hypothetical protein A3B74_01940 [Candidatus Kerfeldbacteria bacterium RIFCSPHIGHO2_02_FULL_42_14]|uniref:Uncharacterized protein n=1 Tax=Candidatus Kerfeldbacteria bacterium RIFCSPHIGHO2_02_FULL_42_14 TaxID=1798540 RepID=A0A1G2AQZ1_9BACT|nr:MAG: hypothetical protein A3B74_01940 [Candidatus Kerfeldbacteria bacterium RIFCSPHIGHO2_02_FULL_42_14]OGY81782.1 MAG: hypothetical protein A3E60_00515 [Candidatus Kerfeldbacteria bacterium RIFCSPHIGHO2_12_FULL_42_13]OGY84471.1 MAG: hypothetical protein A3I91_00130 [Candidatus Kerfeldbacteria bacterium RIFCSPLOWO2_02_FULL_42_19]OGY87989.1 MAG: hypothetical protein A3G01_04200 [Candidatus Kerfeldbacteria bacterium RIFCSPLOWO2_12_FULL_43_9]